MNRKRILICDDAEHHRILLEQALGDDYDIAHSADYRTLPTQIEEYGPIQLLILDLGFPTREGEPSSREYIAQEILPKLRSLFPTLKVIVRSDIVEAPPSPARTQIARQLHENLNVVRILSVNDPATRTLFEVDSILGGPDWLDGSPAWLLQASDLQFGGGGLPCTARTLAQKVEYCLRTNLSPGAESAADMGAPLLAFVTGDLTQQARPDHFDEWREFRDELAKGFEKLNPSRYGMLPGGPIIAIPGNHDVSFDVLRAASVKKHTKRTKDGKDEKHFVYEVGIADEVLQKDAFLRALSWQNCVDGIARESEPWVWDPGFRILNLNEECGIVVALVNSSRWTISHERPKLACVPESVWQRIADEMDALDYDNGALRILAVHHPPLERADRLRLRETDNEEEIAELGAILRIRCRFSLCLSGHIHREQLSVVPPSSGTRELLLSCAGTLRSADRHKLILPRFKLIGLYPSTKMEPYSGRYKKVRVFEFEWDQDKQNFRKTSAGKDGASSFTEMPLES